MSVSSTNSNPASSASTIASKPKLYKDVIQATMEYLELKDLLSVASVDHLWKRASEEPHVWKKQTERLGIPRVISFDGHIRNHKEDLKTLYPITLSGHMIAQTLGKPVGKTPAISEHQFLRLTQPDPWEPQKSMKQTFRFVCQYSFVERILGGATPLILDELGNLVPAPPDYISRSFFADSNPLEEPKATRIPLSLKNLKALSQYPLKGRQNTPVFSQCSDQQVFDQCDTCAPRNSVYFMRDKVVEETMNKSFADQLALVKAKGTPEQEATPLEIRILYSAVSILNRGTCPDNRELITYARASNSISINNHTYQTASGGFARGSGLFVNFDNLVHDHFGVAPGGPAEVLAIEH